MGRYSYSNRLTVESCKRLSTTLLKDRGHLNGRDTTEILGWVSRGQTVGSVEYSISGMNNFGGLICFKYAYSNKRTGEKKDINHGVRLSATPCFFGGRRWWFICPGYECNRRVRDLYLITEYFLCRHCYQLTYESSQECHRFDRLMGREAAKRFEEECRNEEEI